MWDKWDNDAVKGCETRGRLYGYRIRRRIFINRAGVKVLKKLISPWTGSSRLVCADLYFASIQAAKIMFEEGLKFIGVVKTVHKRFPLTHLQSIELGKSGDRVGLVRRKK